MKVLHWTTVWDSVLIKVCHLAVWNTVRLSTSSPGALSLCNCRIILLFHHHRDCSSVFFHLQPRHLVSHKYCLAFGTFRCQSQPPIANLWPSKIPTMTDSPTTQYASASCTDDTAVSYPERPLTTINDLPDEMLMEIAKHLHSQKDFYNLCLVKQFKRVATELLYHTCGSPANLAKLLRTVLQHPDLATRIRDLELTYERNMQAQVTVAVEESELFIRHFEAIGLRPMRQV